MAEISTMPTARNPREHAVVEGDEVTFAWTPVEEASSYRLQVAQDRAFEHLIFNSTVGSRSNLNVSGVFPGDGSTLYWRVQARTAEGWDAFTQPVPFRSVSEAQGMESMGVGDKIPVGRSTAAGTTGVVELWAFVAAIVISLLVVMAAGYYNLVLLG